MNFLFYRIYSILQIVLALKRAFWVWKKTKREREKEKEKREWEIVNVFPSTVWHSSRWKYISSWYSKYVYILNIWKKIFSVIRVVWAYFRKDNISFLPENCPLYTPDFHLRQAPDWSVSEELLWLVDKNRTKLSDQWELFFQELTNQSHDLTFSKSF